jgi:protein-tyrosine phosphatase
MVRSERVFRADYPGLALERDPAVAEQLGLRRVVDLRRHAEADVEVPKWAAHGIEHVLCPLSAGRRSSWHASYERYLEHRPEAVVEAVRLVIDVDRHPVLFHCAAGKDRTGVVATLVLDLLGVEDDEMVADHVASGPAVEPVLERLRGMALYDAMLATTSTEEQMPNEGHVLGLLGWLRERGGAQKWLCAHGLTVQSVQRFRHLMRAT